LNIRQIIKEGGQTMGKASKDKGARGELLWRDECHRAGFTQVQRGGQLPFQKGKALADVIGLYGCHLEIKFQEKLNIRQAVEQAADDCQAGEMPILAHKASRKPWLVTMRAEDFFTIYRAWEAQQPAEDKRQALFLDSMALMAKNLRCWQKAGYPE
jgi:hypothetical protein